MRRAEEATMVRTHRCCTIAVAVVAVVATALLCFSESSEDAAFPVDIPDPGLEAALRDAIPKPPPDPILNTDLAGLTSLNANDEAIANLEGLQYCSSLQTLRLNGNALADISQLRFLTGLITLELNGNLITDIEPLSGLTLLEHLELEANAIADFSPLTGLTNLTELALGDTGLDDSGLRHLMPLTQLQQLMLSYNAITNLDYLIPLTQLQNVQLRGNAIPVLNGLAYLPNLVMVDFSENTVSDLSPLSDLLNLDSIEADNNLIADLSPLATVTTLEDLQVAANLISDVSPLIGLPITLLDLSDNSIDDTDLPDIAAIASLVVLSLEANGLTDIAPLGALASLLDLYLGSNPIASFAPLAGMAALQALGLSDTGIADLTPLTGLVSLRELDLGSNRIEDIIPLVANVGFGAGDSIMLINNLLLLVTGSKDMTDINTLVARGVRVFYDPQSDPPDTAATFRVEDGFVFSDGTVRAASFQAGAADVAEWVQVTEPVEPGDVVRLDPSAPGAYRLAIGPCADRVAGVISTEPGVLLGTSLHRGERALLALVGIVPVKATSEGGPIEPGDLLVASSTPGHAMRWSGPEPCPCALIGKALGPMVDATGTVVVLLMAP